MAELIMSSSAGQTFLLISKITSTLFNASNLPQIQSDELVMLYKLLFDDLK
jgi:hypothetical protein